ncbi:MAG: hypothetical protein MUE69_17410 [Myxococcota bacterium]|jgi:hypothetical protein|nr:hypothetical protein [Myxococcota bacterium]
MNKKLCAYLVPVLALCGLASEARAQCGSFFGTTGADTILVGQAVWEYTNPLTGVTSPIPRGFVGICRKTGSTFEYTEIIGCNDTTQDDLYIYPQQGNDLVAPVTVAIRCGTNGPHIGPFRETTFGFGFAVVGDGTGTGGDTIHGTRNDDALFSFHGNPGANDSSGDLLCGYEGDDFLWGDSSSTRERMSGGVGSDHCYGGTQTSSLSIDHVWSCETRYNSTAVQTSSDPCGSSVPTSTTNGFPMSPYVL